MGPDAAKLREIAGQVETVMRQNPHTRQVNFDWGERAPTVHFVLDQTRLQLIGLSPSEAATQLQFLLTGVPVTQVREDIRTVELVARSAGAERLDPARLNDLTLTNRDGRPISLSQIGHIEMRPEDPILRRRDRVPTITVESDIDEAVSAAASLAGDPAGPAAGHGPIARRLSDRTGRQYRGSRQGERRSGADLPGDDARHLTDPWSSRRGRCQA